MKKKKWKEHFRQKKHYEQKHRGTDQRGFRSNKQQAFISFGEKKKNYTAERNSRRKLKKQREREDVRGREMA